MATQVQTATEQLQKLQLRAETSIDYEQEKYKYESYLPHFTPGTQPPIEEFEHVDVGLRADPEKKNLLSAHGVTHEEITPAIGTEIHGIQLSQLNPAQLDELALLAAERGVVLFRDQDFADIGPERQRQYGQHFGPLHVHQMGGQIKDYPELLPVYRDFTAGAVDNEIKDNASVHDHRDRYIREPIETVHPVVRTHPVTKQLSLYVNRLYTKRIVGMKQEESTSLLNFLFDHIERGQDWHLRVHWKPGTVVVYDNRNTQHSALRDFRVEEGTTKRHMLRITPQAERPYFAEP
ncbi:Alpha-ketoglutarate-dependent taurine dioxygenase [Colletotrichum sp. SAR11_59]|nr:Alpha-ketoglutarate-dependent taurine dioxygenase [Colletotrichum sp. SAR11_59]